MPHEKMNAAIVGIFHKHKVDKIALPTLSRIAAQSLTEDEDVQNIVTYALHTHVLSSPESYTVTKGMKGGVTLRQPKENG